MVLPVVLLPPPMIVAVMTLATVVMTPASVMVIVDGDVQSETENLPGYVPGVIARGVAGRLVAATAMPAGVGWGPRMRRRSRMVRWPTTMAVMLFSPAAVMSFLPPVDEDEALSLIVVQHTDDDLMAGFVERLA